jgi:hypothetical protein
MGRLKPGATYIYEHVNGITYAREQGEPIYARFEIGRTLERQTRDKTLSNSILWADILDEAEHHQQLKDAVEKCKMLYYLIKDNGNKEKA